MSSINRKFIRLPEALMEVKRAFPEDMVKDVDGVKEWLETPVVINRYGYLFFCTEIEDAQIIEDVIRAIPQSIEDVIEE